MAARNQEKPKATKARPRPTGVKGAAKGLAQAVPGRFVTNRATTFGTEPALPPEPPAAVVPSQRPMPNWWPAANARRLALLVAKAERGLTAGEEAELVTVRRRVMNALDRFAPLPPVPKASAGRVTIGGGPVASVPLSRRAAHHPTRPGRLQEL